MKVKFKIKGIDCANCAAELERAIQKIDGVTEASLSFMTEKLVMEIEGCQEFCIIYSNKDRYIHKQY